MVRFADRFPSKRFFNPGQLEEEELLQAPGIDLPAQPATPSPELLARVSARTQLPTPVKETEEPLPVLQTPAADRLKILAQEPVADARPSKMDRVLAGIMGGARGWNSTWSRETPGEIFRDTRDILDRPRREAQQVQALELERAKAAAAAEDKELDNRIRQENLRAVYEARMEAIRQRREKAGMESADRGQRSVESLLARTTGTRGPVYMRGADDPDFPAGHPALDARAYAPQQIDGRVYYMPTGNAKIEPWLIQMVKKETDLDLGEYATPDQMRAARDILMGKMRATREGDAALARYTTMMDVMEKKMDMQDKDLRARGQRAAMLQASRRPVVERQIEAMDKAKRAELARAEQQKKQEDARTAAWQAKELADLETQTMNGMPLSPEERERARRKVQEGAMDRYLNAHNAYAFTLQGHGINPVDAPVFDTHAELQGHAERILNGPASGAEQAPPASRPMPGKPVPKPAPVSKPTPTPAPAPAPATPAPAPAPTQKPKTMLRVNPKTGKLEEVPPEARK